MPDEKVTREDRKVKGGIMTELSVSAGVGKVPEIIRFRHIDGPLDLTSALYADPVTFSAEESQMAIDRGLGVHATSMVTIAISKLGLYIAEVETAYGLYPTLNEKTGEYELSQVDKDKLAKKDPNAFQKYNLFREAQNQLRKLYDLECQADPNHHMQQEVLRSGVLQIVATTRGEARRTEGQSKTYRHADDLAYDAEKAIQDFEWPLDPEDPTKTRRAAISASDQLRVKEGEHYCYVNAKGLTAQTRDVLAHCITLKKDFPADQREAFKKQVEAIKPTRGIAVWQLPDPLWDPIRPKAADGNVTRFTKFLARGVVYSVNSAVNLAGGAVKLVSAPVVYAVKKIANPEPLDTTRDPFLEAKAKEMASNILPVLKNIVVEEGETLFEKFGKMLNEKMKTFSGDNNDKTKLRALIIYQTLLGVSKEQFAELTNTDTKCKAFQEYLSPFHTITEIAQIRDARDKAQAAQLALSNAYQKAYGDEIKKLGSGATVEAIQNAMKSAEAAANKASDFIKAKGEFDAAMHRLDPKLLDPENKQGPQFLRANLFGNVYHVGSTIAGVLEGMGGRDPVMGAAALATMGAGIGFTAIVAAHGGSIAAAAKTNEFIALASKSKVFPAFYHGVMPVEAGAGKMKVAFTSFVNGLVLGKATYIALSLGRSAVGGGEGFSTKLLGAIAERPVESALAAAALYAMGHTMVLKMHEQAAEGNWHIFDELTASMKPAAIIIDQFLPVYHLFKSAHPESIDAKKEAEFLDRMATLMARGLLERAGKKFEEIKPEELAKLKDIIADVLRTEKLDGKDSATIAENLKTTLTTAITANYPEGTDRANLLKAVDEQFSKAAEAAAPTPQQTLIAELSEQLRNRKDLNEHTYLRCLTEAQMLQSMNGNLDIKNVVIAAIGSVKPMPKGEVVAEEVDSPRASIATIGVNAGPRESVTETESVGPALQTFDNDVYFYKKDLTKDPTGKTVEFDHEGKPVGLGIKSTLDSQSPLKFLELYYAQEVVKYSEGFSKNNEQPQLELNHNQAKQAYLSELFSRDLLTSKRDGTPLWRAISEESKTHAAVEKITGRKFESLRDQRIPAKENRGWAFARDLMGTAVGGALRLVHGVALGATVGAIGHAVMRFADADHSTLRAWDKYMGYDNLTAAGNGLVALAAVLPSRIMSNVGRTAAVAAIRVTGSGAEAGVVSGGVAAARTFTGAVRAATNKRPDDVPLWRASMAEAKLVKPAEDQKKSNVLTLAQYKNSLKNISDRLSHLTGGVLSIPQRRLSAALNAIQNESGVEKMNLIVLKTLFRDEVKMIEEKLREAQIPEKEHDAYMLASLQRLFHEELSACKANENATFDLSGNGAFFNAFTMIAKESKEATVSKEQKDARVSFVAALAGKEFDMHEPDPTTKLANETQRAADAAYTSIVESAKNLREGYQKKIMASRPLSAREHDELDAFLKKLEEGLDAKIIQQIRDDAAEALTSSKTVQNESNVTATETSQRRVVGGGLPPAGVVASTGVFAPKSNGSQSATPAADADNSAPRSGPGNT